METLLQQKGQLRKHIKVLWGQVAPEAKEPWARDVVKSITALPWWHSAEAVLCYQTMWDEIDTAPLIAQARTQGKTLYLPVIDDSDMEFVSDSGRSWTPEQSQTLIICPGRAFDRTGKRLGRGKGYYDRFLSGPGAGLHAIGIGAPFQLVDKVPVSEADVPLEMVVVPGVVCRC